MIENRGLQRRIKRLHRTTHRETRSKRMLMLQIPVNGRGEGSDTNATSSRCLRTSCKHKKGEQKAIKAAAHRALLAIHQ